MAQDHRKDARFETLLQLNPLPTVVTRASDGTYLQVNDAFLDLIGYSRAEVIGSNGVALGIVSAVQRLANMQTLRETGGSIAVQVRAKNGEARTLQATSATIDFGGESCLVSVCIDTSERLASDAQLRDSEARARARADELAVLMDALPATVLIAADAECKHVRTNRAGHELLRSRPGTNVSKTASETSPTRHFKVYVNNQEVPPHDLPLQRAARGSEVRNHEEQLHFEDGQVVHLYGSAVPLRDASGHPRGAIGAFVDVTRLKQAEAALREADRRKDEFLALLSHELRNPLAPIVAAAQTMELEGDTSAEHEREIIVRQSQHLVRLVDDLLDVSRVSRGLVTLSKRPIELAVVIDTAVEAITPLIEERRHRLQVVVPRQGLLVNVDEIRLTQVVCNLLTNAARYTPYRGCIEVGAALEGNEAVLRIRDNGAGIDASLLPHIFDLFVQGGRGIDRSQGGLGLGLALVRSLVTLHGGRVTAHSDGAHLGSEFRVRLPICASMTGESMTPAPDATPSPGASNTPRLRILVVDDNQDAAELTAKLLRRAGHEVRVAYDPYFALAAASNFKPQVAILDIGLPEMDGYVLASELRAMLGNCTPAMIAITGYGQEGDRKRSEQAGFSAHLVKPVTGKTLFAMLDSLSARCPVAVAGQ